MTDLGTARFLMDRSRFRSTVRAEFAVLQQLFASTGRRDVLSCGIVVAV